MLEEQMLRIYVPLLDFISDLLSQIQDNVSGIRELTNQVVLDFERNMFKENFSRKEIEDIKYAFSATVDELILLSESKIQEEWAKFPLQMEYFNENSAGEGFYSRLEELRLSGDRFLPVVEFYYWCLEFGFRGKYIVHGLERIDGLTKDIRIQLLSSKEINLKNKPQRINFNKSYIGYLMFGLNFKTLLGVLTLSVVILQILLNARINQLVS